MQEIEKLMKKNKNSLQYRVIKALILIRMSRQFEALTLLNDVHRQIPTDESILQTMSMCYREIDRSNFFEFFSHRPEIIFISLSLDLFQR